MTNATVSKLAPELAALSSAPTAARIFPAASVVPPSWPLNRWIAANPWWGVRHQEAEQASQVSGVRQKSSIFMPMAFYRDAWRGGRIHLEDLNAATAEMGVNNQVDLLRRALEKESVSDLKPAPLMLDQNPQGALLPALDPMREQVARTCGLFFDQRQSGGFVRAMSDDLFESWLTQTVHDRALNQRTGLKGARKVLEEVPRDYLQAFEWACTTLELSETDCECLSHRLLFELVGWASWCRGIDWRAGLEGRDSGLAEQLLSVLLVWEAVAVRVATQDQRYVWQRAWGDFRDTANRFGRHQDSANPLRVWHRAYELGYQRQLAKSLAANLTASRSVDSQERSPDFQAVFCIDVRSEVIRRHLEDSSPNGETVGFAGFFGMPIVHQTLGPDDDTARLPGLLAPAYRLVESAGNPRQDRMVRRSAEKRETIRQSVRKAKYSSFSSFTLVESTGLAWAWKLVRDSLNLNGESASASTATQHRLHQCHGGDPVSDSERVQLAENLLRGMSLTSNFAALLVFVGHASHADNNPHRASLACGACGGQNGGLNASLAAELINDPVVRAGLVTRGIRIPDFTIAVAAEHCTVTDRVALVQSAKVPDAYLNRIKQLEESFAEAGRRARRERATALGLNGLNDEPLLQAVIKRASNWSEVRAEWGLANNAAIIFAKRFRTRGVDLKGRAFLHDYDPALDSEGAILEALMTAPLVVANWINLQYLGSVAAPDTFGAGNKLLHSVVGGNIGVIEGNDPDLRIGLPLQSVHDGDKWRHEPVRLSVVIDAPAERIESILARQPDVAALVDNRWLWLFRLGRDGMEQYGKGGWHLVNQGS